MRMRVLEGISGRESIQLGLTKVNRAVRQGRVGWCRVPKKSGVCWLGCTGKCGAEGGMSQAEMVILLRGS